MESAPSRRPGRFGKDKRVRNRGEFQHVFDTGARAHGRYFTVIAATVASPGQRLGIVASRKFGGAIQRNRAKRLIREIFRQNLPLPAGPDVHLVVIPRRELLDASYEHLESDFLNTCRRAAARLGPRVGR